ITRVGCQEGQTLMITATQIPTHPFVAALNVGQLLNRLRFHLVQAWFFPKGNCKMAECLSHRLVSVARQFVPENRFDEVARGGEEAVQALPRQVWAEPHVEYLRASATELARTHDPEPDTERKRVLRPVDELVVSLWRVVFDQVDPRLKVIARLGECLDQGLCPADAYLYLHDPARDKTVYGE